MQTPVTQPPGLDWDDVRLFLVLYRSRTMGEAAVALDVDPSTVSRRLAGLEETLDTVLFDRGREGLRPTKAAEDLFPTAELAEDGIAGFAHAADGLEREVSGLVRLTCPPDTDVLVLPVLRDLLDEHPDLRFTLEPSEELLDLSRREADLALRVVRPRSGSLVVRRVMTIRWRPVATPALVARLGPLTDLSSVPWIGWSEGSAAAHLQRWFQTMGVSVEPVLRSDRLVAHVAAARAGLGVALLPAPTISHHGLVPIEIDLPGHETSLPEDELFLVTHQALVNVPRVRATWEALTERLSDLPAE